MLQPDKDAFGCDPFAVLHAPTAASAGGPPQRPESPSPALPPKKSKQPPPRPAPPRPATVTVYTYSSFIYYRLLNLCGGNGNHLLCFQGPSVRPAQTVPSPSPDPRSGADDGFGADPFGGSSAGGGFADFANFDSKVGRVMLSSIHLLMVCSY